MSQIVVCNQDDDFDDKPTEELYRIIDLGVQRTAENLLQMAKAVASLEKRGEDLSRMRLGIMNHLRKIACGQLLPQVVTEFAGSPMLISYVGNLPIPDQEHIAKDRKPVLLVVDASGGGFTHRLVDPALLAREQINQVFARDHIRSEAEQAIWLDQKRNKTKSPTKEKVGNLSIDKERAGVMHRNEFISLADLEVAVRILKRRQS